MVSVNDHIVEAKLLILFFCTIVDLYLDLRIILGCVRVVNEAVREWIVQDQSKRRVALNERL